MAQIKAIPGTNGMYGVTKTGQVFTKKTKGPGPDADEWVRRVTCTTNSAGYKHFGAYVRGGRKFMNVHEAVLLAWRGPRPEGKDVIMHKNNDKSDNRLANLKYATKSENELHKHQDADPLDPRIKRAMEVFELETVEQAETALRYLDYSSSSSERSG